MAKKKKRKSETEPEWFEAPEDDVSAESEAKPDDPIEEKPVEEKPPPAPPDPNAPSPIPLKVFVRLAGPKWDQMAGFLHYAKHEKLGPRTVPEWRAAHQEFMQKPVK